MAPMILAVVFYGGVQASLVQHHMTRCVATCRSRCPKPFELLRRRLRCRAIASLSCTPGFIHVKLESMVQTYTARTAPVQVAKWP